MVCGILVAVGFGLISYPNPELRKTVTDWRLEDAFVTGADEQRVLSALRQAEGGTGEIVRLTEAEFRALKLPYSIGFPVEEDSARRFLIRYAGVQDPDDGRVYVAERQIFAAPWWSPHRFIYKAGQAEVNALGDVVELTFERDVAGLVGLPCSMASSAPYTASSSDSSSPSCAARDYRRCRKVRRRTGAGS